MKKSCIATLFAIVLASIFCWTAKTETEALNVQESTTLRTAGPKLTDPRIIEQTTTDENSPGGIDSYRIQPDDLMNIATKPPKKELQSKDPVKVGKDGYIKVAFLDPIKAEGLTVIELEDKLQEAYVPDYYKDIQVSVLLLSTYFVSGDVREPGEKGLGKGITLTRAIDAARGFTDFANRRNVKIFKTIGGKQVVRKYNLKRIEAGREDDPLIEPNDRIYVSRKSILGIF